MRSLRSPSRETVMSTVLLMVVGLLWGSALSRPPDDREFLIQTERLPQDLNFMPSLSNGHLGFTVFGDAIYMNGVYNGHGGNSRRARLPNWLNISAEVLIGRDDRRLRLLPDTTRYELWLREGYFCSTQTYASAGLTLQQRTYAHRYFNRALIYDLLVQRSSAGEPLTLRLKQSPGGPSDAFVFKPLSASAASFRLHDDVRVLHAITKEVEHEAFQSKRTSLFVVFSEDLGQDKVLRMEVGDKTLYYRFVVTADQLEAVALREMQDVLSVSPPHRLLEQHVAQWNRFWEEFSIEVRGDLELSHTINAGIFYLANSLPSPHTNQPNSPYFGLSPTGLARGALDADYEGHNFWDTEIWMLPAVTQFSTHWTKELLQYRLRCLAGAQYNAATTGYQGARFPWESAFTGTEVTNPCCPEVATQEVHISADIAIALQHFYATTNDHSWLCQTAWPLATEIAVFISSRVEWNARTGRFHVTKVMGPDEYHENVDDNVYTNVAFRKALQFARCPISRPSGSL